MSRLDASAKGVFLITVTPFTEGGALDLASTDRMVSLLPHRSAYSAAALSDSSHRREKGSSMSTRLSGFSSMVAMSNAGSRCRCVMPASARDFR